MLAYASVLIGFVVGVIATNAAYAAGVRVPSRDVLRLATFVGAAVPLSLLLALPTTSRAAYLTRLAGALAGLGISMLWAWELFILSLDLTDNSFMGTIYLMVLLPAAIVAIAMTVADSVRRIRVRSG